MDGNNVGIGYTKMDNATIVDPSKDIGETARAGFGWLAGGRVITQVIQLANSIILARLLVPEDFGLLAMAMAVGGSARAVGDFGVSAIVVQRKEMDEDFLSAAFTLNFAVFAAMALVQILIAPVGGLLMNEPRVVGVMLGLAVGVPISGVGSFYQGLIKRSLRFPRLVALSFVTIALNTVVACSLAALGFGVWSLVIAQVVASVGAAFTAQRLVGCWVPFSVQAARRHFSEILSFGKYATGNSLISYLVYNADYLFIGRLLPTQQLGFYYFAYEKSRLVSARFLNLISGIAFPTFSKVSENTERLRSAYRAVTISGFALIAPATVFLAVHAEEVIPFVFGPKWSSSILIFQILSIPVLINALTSGVGSVVYAIGKPEISFNINRWFVAPLIVSYFLGAKFGGILGVAIAVAIVKGSASLTKLMVTFSYLGWKPLPILRPVFLILLGSLSAGGLSMLKIFSATVFPVWLNLVIAWVLFVGFFVISQATTNREGLRVIWGSLLGQSGVVWCTRRVPGLVRQIFAMP